MKAAQRREIADRIAQMAVDKLDAYEHLLFPEDLLEIQQTLEDDIYRALGER